MSPTRPSARCAAGHAVSGSGGRWPASAGPGGRPLAHAEQPQRPLLLELQGASGWRRDTPDPAAEFSDLSPDCWLSQDPEAECQLRRADGAASLDVQGEGHRGQVLVPELPVSRAAAGPGAWRPRLALLAGRPPGRPADWPPGRPADWPPGRPADWPPGRPADWPPGRLADWPADRLADRPADRGKQAEHLPVAEHPGRGAEPLGRLRDPHGQKSNILLSRTSLRCCAQPSLCHTVGKCCPPRACAEECHAHGIRPVQGRRSFAR